MAHLLCPLHVLYESSALGNFWGNKGQAEKAEGKVGEREKDKSKPLFVLIVYKHIEQSWNIAET